MRVLQIAFSAWACHLTLLETVFTLNYPAESDHCHQFSCIPEEYVMYVNILSFTVNYTVTRLGVDKVKPKGRFKYFELIDQRLVGFWWVVGCGGLGCWPPIFPSSHSILKMVHQVD